MSDEDIFQRNRASRALLAAMTELAAQSDRSLIELEGYPLVDAYRLAQDVYGDDLPDFWRIWAQWQLPPDLSTMGEL